MFMNMSYINALDNSTGESHSTPLVHHHFARLESKEHIMLMSDMTVNDTNDKWITTTCYPSPKKDVLLFLCLMGTKGFCPFQTEGGVAISFRKAYFERQNSTNARKVDVVPSNAIQTSNDGNEMEATMAAVLCVASRVNGVGGVSLRQYIPAIYSHIEKFDKLKEHKLVESELKYNKALASVLDNTLIPFCAPPNQEWPEWLGNELPGSRFGHISRPRNDEMVDIKTSFELFGECKDLTAGVKLPNMKQIVDRIMKQKVWKVHIVFVRKLQGLYYEDTTKPFVQPIGYDIRFAAVKRCKKDEELELCEIKNLPGIDGFEEGSKLILFFEFNSVDETKEVAS